MHYGWKHHEVLKTLNQQILKLKWEDKLLENIELPELTEKEIENLNDPKTNKITHLRSVHKEALCQFYSNLLSNFYFNLTQILWKNRKSRNNSQIILWG